MFHGGWFTFLRAEDEQPHKITAALLRRVLRYAGPYRRHIAGMLALILLGAGLNLVSPLLFRLLIDRALPEDDLTLLAWITLALLLAPILRGAINVLQRRLNAIVGEGVIYDLRVALFTRLQQMSLRFFTNTRIGELMSRLNNDVVGAQNAISNTIVNFVTNLVEAAAILGVMLTLEWRLTLASVMILPLFIVVARRLGARLRDISRQQMEINAQMNAHMNETLSIGGALLVKLFGRQAEEAQRFGERAAGVRQMGVQRAVVGSVFFALLGLLGAFGVAIIYGVGGYLVIAGPFTVGTIVAFGSYLGSLYGSLQGLAGAPVEFSTSLVSFERVFEVLDLPQEISEAPDAIALPNPRGELQFDGVSFRYTVDEENLLSQVKRYGRMDEVRAVLSGDGAKGRAQKNPALAQADAHGQADGEAGKSQAREIALDEITFTAKAGQLVALVGPSGAGKTTLTYLIPRLYDPQQGSIRLDGRDLRSLRLDSLAAAIGMVTQETYLFHDTIHTNLTYARPNATQAEIEAATRAANIHDFIAALPQGYATVVGERGYRLSGGEKQRLALARVILKDPRILVLDEATSHLDSESEALIQDALRRVMAGRTAIVIAHRLSTILAADLILVLDRGRIVERGTHADLLAQNGLYAQLYETQFQRSNAG